MGRFLLKRLAGLLGVLLVMSLIVFVLHDKGIADQRRVQFGQHCLQPRLHCIYLIIRGWRALLLRIYVVTLQLLRKLCRPFPEHLVLLTFAGSERVKLLHFVQSNLGEVPRRR